MKVILGFLVMLCVYYLYNAQKMSSIVDALNDQGWVLYLNADNCGFCHLQIKFLGSYFSEIQKIHCDDSRNAEKCAKYTELPCWVKEGYVRPGARLSINAFKKLLGSSE
jgi:hypothetical protein